MAERITYIHRITSTHPSDCEDDYAAQLDHRLAMIQRAHAHAVSYEVESVTEVAYLLLEFGRAARRHVS